jgi:23S rRNA (guanosine2251-2'-O)-methyltransferase
VDGRRVTRGHGPPRLDFDDVMYGIHVVEEALSSGEPLRAIRISDERKRDPQLRRLIAEAKERNIPVRFEAREFFRRLPFKTHQGVIAVAPPFDYASLHDALGSRRADRALFLVLDRLTDPHNVGAIIRTAECAGADAVVLPERRSAGVNATVRKAAAGATAHLPVVRVANVSQTIRALKKAGIWVAGADLGPETAMMTDLDLNRDLALVIGAEGTGLAELVKRECDFLVRIPTVGKTASLNASVAAAVLIYEVLRQRALGRSGGRNGY